MKRQYGVTLIELMVTLSVVAIMLTIAIPGFVETMASNRMTGVVTDLMGTINFARSEAVKRGTSVSVCRSSNGSSCTGTWTEGWIVFVDNDADGTVDTSGVVDEILKINGALGGNYTLSSTEFASTSVIYARNGTANATGTFIACSDSQENKARGVIISLTRPRFASDTDSDGIPEKDDGSDITSCESP